MDAKKMEGVYIRKPRLLCVAKELSKFEEPYKTMDAMLLLLESCAKDSTDTD